MRKLILIVIMSGYQLSAFSLGDKSILPASNDAITGTARSLNQLTPEEVEKERMGPQEMQEKIYQEDLKREREQEEKRKKKEKEDSTFSDEQF